MVQIETALSRNQHSSVIKHQAVHHDVKSSQREPHSTVKCTDIAHSIYGHKLEGRSQTKTKPSPYTTIQTKLHTHKL